MLEEAPDLAITLEKESARGNSAKGESASEKRSQVVFSHPCSVHIPGQFENFSTNRTLSPSSIISAEHETNKVSKLAQWL